MDSEDSHDASRDRRDRLLAALLAADPGLILLECNDGIAHLLGTNEPARILLVTASHWAGPDALRGALKHLATHVPADSVATQLVVVGGGDEVEPTIKHATPRNQPVPLGFYHLVGEGPLVHVSGRKLPLLERAAEKVEATAPLTSEALAEATIRREAFFEQGRKVVDALKGRYQVTAAIAATSTALFGLSYLWGSDVHDQVLFRMGAGSGQALMRGEVWRLFSSTFLHINPVHLIVNMIALWSFGATLEAILGQRRYLALYAASALGGSLATMLLRPERWSAGSSGAIWGLMTAGIAIALRPKGLLPPLMVVALRRRVWTPLVINLGISLIPGLDLHANIGGGIVGFLLAITVLTSGLAPVGKRTDPKRVEAAPSRLAGVLGVGAGAAMAISVVAGFVVGRPWTLKGPPALVRTTVADTGLSIALPSAIAAELQPGEQGRFRAFTYGRLVDSPLVLEVLVFPLPRELPDEDVDAFLDDMRKELDEHVAPNAVRTAPAKRMNVGPRPGLLAEYDLNGLHFTDFWVAIGRQKVVVRAFGLQARPEAWRGVEESVAASLEVSR